MINGIDSPYKGSGGLTREQFLFHETRVVARLMTDENLSDQEIIDRVVSENLFQFPTERMIRNLAGVCVKRLHCFVLQVWSRMSLLTEKSGCFLRV